MKKGFIFIAIINLFVINKISAMEDQYKIEFIKSFKEKCSEISNIEETVIQPINQATKQNIDKEALVELLYKIYSNNEDYKSLGSESFICYILNDQETLISLVSSEINNKVEFIRYFLEKCNSNSSIKTILPLISMMTARRFNEETLAEFLYTACSENSDYVSLGHKKAIDDIFGSFEGFSGNLLPNIMGVFANKDNAKGCILS